MSMNWHRSKRSVTFRYVFGRVQAEDKELRLVNSMWHMLTKEDGNAQILADIVAWTDARV